MGSPGDFERETTAPLSICCHLPPSPCANFSNSSVMVISCIHAAHTKYESNPLDWQWVVEISYHLFMRQDMERFQEMCEDWLLGQGDYGIFEDWSAIDRSRDGYIRIRDGLVSKGEIQEMNNKENFYNEGPYQARIHGFILAYHQVVAYHWWLSFRPMKSDRYLEFEVSLVRVMYLACSYIFLVLMERNFSVGMRIRQA
jgi:hypothetical protein